jgi:hypothetical protein
MMEKGNSDQEALRGKLAERYERAALQHYDDPKIRPQEIVVVPMPKGAAEDVTYQVLSSHLRDEDFDSIRRSLKTEAANILVAYRARWIPGPKAKFDIAAEREIAGFSLRRENTVTIFQPAGRESNDVSKALVAASARVALASNAKWKSNDRFYVAVPESDTKSAAVLRSLNAQYTDKVMHNPILARGVAGIFKVDNLEQEFCRPWTKLAL